MRKCGKCSEPGHNARTCTKKKKKMVVDTPISAVTSSNQEQEKKICIMEDCQKVFYPVSRTEHFCSSECAFKSMVRREKKKVEIIPNEY